MENWQTTMQPLMDSLGITDKINNLLDIGDNNMAELISKMVDDQHYEIANAVNAQHIKDAFEYAKANNVQYYRAKTSTGRVYGWDEKAINPSNHSTGYFVEQKSATGENAGWFENPYYVASGSEDDVPAAIIVEEPAPAIVEPVKATLVTKQPITPQVDYKALYASAENRIAELNREILGKEELIVRLKQDIKVINEQKDEIQAQLDNIRNAFKTLIDEYNIAKG